MSEKIQFEVMDVNALNQCLLLLRNSLDKSLQKGTFNWDESQNIFVAHSTLAKAVSVLDFYQKFIKNKAQKVPTDAELNN